MISGKNVEISRKNLLGFESRFLGFLAGFGLGLGFGAQKTRVVSELVRCSGVSYLRGRL